MTKKNSNLKLLAVCLAVVILSLAGAWGIRMVLAEWQDAPAEGPTAGMPPGPVWLQTTTPFTEQPGSISVSDAIGIGTTGPNASLEVKRTTSDSNFAAWIEGLDTSNYGLGVNIANTTDAKAIADFKSDNTSKFFVRADGNIGIGTTSPTQKLDVIGQIHATGDICTETGGGVCLSAVGGGGLPEIVGATAISYNGSLNRDPEVEQVGYGIANSLCSATPGLEGSHVCTTDEVLNTINQDAFDFSSLESDPLAPIPYWVSAGIPFPSYDTFMNDCYGWTSMDSSAAGVVWVFYTDGKKMVYGFPCNAEPQFLPQFLCCK